MPVGDKVTVGIPRTLFYCTYFPAWRRFFAELGMEVVVSPLTTRAIVDRGVELAVTDACVPIKVMHGHASWLAREGVDYLFVPRVVSTDRQLVYCPKFLGLPDMISASVPDLPQMLSPRYDSRKGPRELARVATALAKQLGASSQAAAGALAAARQTHRQYQEALWRGVPLERALGEATGQPIEAQAARRATHTGGDPPLLRLAVIGYPYMVYDRQLNLDLLPKLAKMGVEVVTSQETDPSVWRRHRERLPKDLFWTFSQEAVLAGYHFLGDRRSCDGVIHLTAFSCGPDSVADKLLEMEAERLGSVPFMSLMIDEHTGEAGFATRLEAFVDMMRRRRVVGAAGADQVDPAARAPIEAAAPITGRRRRLPRRKRRVSFPYLGTLPEVFREVLEDAGNEVIMPPRPSRHTLTLGTELSPEFACLPFKILLGTYLEAIEAGADTLISSGGIGPCRAGLYTMVQERILHAAGHKVDLITLEPPRLDVAGTLNKIAALNSARRPFWRIISLIRRAWRKVQALDELETMSHTVRPREVTRGTTTIAWSKARNLVYQAQDRREIDAALSAGRQLLDGVPQRVDHEPLRVGIVGEIYVLVEPASNFELEETLGEMGVQPVRELYMSGWTRESNLWGRPDGRLAYHAAEAALPYLEEMIGGHGQESVGNAVLFARAGLDGVIQLAPFTCIPEIVAKSALEKACPQLGLPFLSISIDEQTGRAGLSTRLEAFIDLMARRKAHGIAPQIGARPVDRGAGERPAADTDGAAGAGRS